MMTEIQRIKQLEELADILIQSIPYSEEWCDAKERYIQFKSTNCYEEK